MRPGARAAWLALPDGLTAAAFVVVWISPFALGALAVKTAMLTMLLEFFLVHATGFLTVLLGRSGLPRPTRWLALGGLAVFYLLMIGTFAWSFGEWWPLLGFAWLVVGKVAWGRGLPGDDETMWRMAAWAGSVAAYLFACFATVVPPVPRLGMTEALQPAFGLGDGGGLWLEEPQRVVAMGALYFALLCAGKFLLARRLGAARARQVVG